VPEQPNVLLVLTDQHRLEAVGCYAETPCRTPNLDRLADRGVRFETAYTTCPVCTPARSSVATGQFPHATGLTGNVGNQTTAFHTLPDAPHLLSRRLDRAGYGLGYTGKWHLAPPSGRLFGREFESFMPGDLGYEGHDVPGHGGGGWDVPGYEEYLDENGYELEFTEREADAPYGRRSECVEAPTEATVPYYLVEHSIELMEAFRGRDDPFFLWHNFWGPIPRCAPPGSSWRRTATSRFRRGRTSRGRPRRPRSRRGSGATPTRRRSRGTTGPRPSATTTRSPR